MSQKTNFIKEKFICKKIMLNYIQLKEKCGEKIDRKNH